MRMNWFPRDDGSSLVPKETNMYIHQDLIVIAKRYLKQESLWLLSWRGTYRELCAEILEDDEEM